ncbi:MAG TPA: exodeoxyribonuclease VII large subunit [Ignavibacteriales bacterium]|nr:exodeoxyribonuclease VII large subunit [Ignavibacteriales bacterium]
MSEIKEQIFSVSEITKSIKFILESTFEKISIEGEISNFKAHVSGHWYFNLKDEGAVINCTMWKGVNNYVFFTPADGMKIIVTGRITVYPPRGSYQLDVRSMKPAGVGELQAAFERLKQKLSEEGLFDEKYKKELPSFPKKIGLITASDGAAVKDMISVAERRFPLVELLVVPTKVQGAGAAENIAENIHKLNLLNDIDVIILARGGGSIEDLWAFNEEIVARAIFKSKIPVISGVGHEVDFTIADFVADFRAPTPSVAMELATPDIEELKSFIKDSYSLSCDIIERTLENYRSELEEEISSYAFRYPLEKIRKYSQMVDLNTYKIVQKIDKRILIASNRIAYLSKSIEMHDIEKSLQKGFALIKQDSKFIPRKISFNINKPATITFYDGKIELK